MLGIETHVPEVPSALPVHEQVVNVVSKGIAVQEESPRAKFVNEVSYYPVPGVYEI